MSCDQHRRPSVGSQLRPGHRLPGLRAAIVVLGFILPAADAFALWGDRLELFAAETFTSDDNVFRISKDLDPKTALGSPSRGDTYRSTLLGFNLDVPVSRQRFQVNETWNDTRYQRFSDLDFTGHNGKAVWLWQADNDLSGNLGYAESYALASFANILGRTPDPLKTQQTFGQANYLITPRWRLEAGAGELKQTNGDTARKENDVDIRTTDLTLSYVTPDEDHIGLSVRGEEGHYPNRQFVAGSPFDNAYSQRGVGAVIDWTITGKSHLNARVDRVRREYSQLPQRDFNGTTFRAVYDWKPTGKFSLTAVAQKDISAIEDVRTSFVLVKGFSLRPSFDVSSKVNLSGSLDYSIRDYLGDPGIVLGTAPNRSDRVRSAFVAASYRPDRAFTLMLSLLREVRTSNTPFTDYQARVVQLNIRFAF